MVCVACVQEYCVPSQTHARFYRLAPLIGMFGQKSEQLMKCRPGQPENCLFFFWNTHNLTHQITSEQRVWKLSDGRLKLTWSWSYGPLMCGPYLLCTFFGGRYSRVPLPGGVILCRRIILTPRLCGLVYEKAFTGLTANGAAERCVQNLSRDRYACMYSPVQNSEIMVGLLSYIFACSLGNINEYVTQ